MHWRLIPLLDAPGQVQMAIDTWLLVQHQRGLHPPTLRFYTWHPVAISLGYHQKQQPVHWQHLVWQGLPLEIVRRPTGGRAVLHQGDLTYAVVTSGLIGTRLQVYQTLCEFLIAGWRSLGVELHYGQAGRGYIHNPNCFATATGADLVTSNNFKLIGSAQLYRDGAILQHGSMRLNPDAELFQQVFEVDLGLPPQSVAIAQPDSIMNALIASATECFGVTFQVQPLSAQEKRDILHFAQVQR